jgi:hypothetical protein
MDQPRIGVVLGVFSAFGVGASMMAPDLFWFGAFICYGAAAATVHRYWVDLKPLLAARVPRVPVWEFALVISMLLAEVGTPSYLIVARDGIQKPATSTVAISESIKPIFEPPTTKPAAAPEQESAPFPKVVEPPLPPPHPPQAPEQLPEVIPKAEVDIGPKIIYPFPSSALKKGRTFAHFTELEQVISPYKTLMSREADEAFKKYINLWLVVRGHVNDVYDGGQNCGYCIRIMLIRQPGKTPSSSGVPFVNMSFNKRWAKEIGLIQKDEEVTSVCDICYADDWNLSLTDCELLK